MEEDNNVIRRIEKIEVKMERMEEELNRQGRTDAVMHAEFKSLREDFNSLKSDVLLTIKENTDRTWNLINKCLRIIMVLISVVVAVAGIKLGPEILKALLL